MRKFQRVSAFLLAAVLMFSMSLTAYAHDYVQLDKKGTITVTMRMGETAVGGGTLTLYRVGEVREDDGNYTFQPAGDFASCGESFEDVTAPALAENLSRYAKENKRSGVTKNIGENGTVTFTELEVGLYLFVQNKAASGYCEAEPFLVSLPYMQDNGQYSYHVDASPKAELIKEPEPTSPQPTKPTDPTLPQTGQLWWPVPLLAVAGMALFALGWALSKGKRKEHEG